MRLLALIASLLVWFTLAPGGALGLVFRGMTWRGRRKRLADGPPAEPAPWQADPGAVPDTAAPASAEVTLPAVVSEREPRFVRPSAAPLDPPRPAIRRERTFGYVTAPDAGDHRRDLREQATRIQRLCRELDLSLVRIVSDVESANRAPVERPGLAGALERLAAGEASCLVVTELRRLAPTAEDWRRLAERVDRRAVRVVALDVQLDTSAEAGAWELAGQGAGPRVR